MVLEAEQYHLHKIEETNFYYIHAQSYTNFSIDIFKFLLPLTKLQLTWMELSVIFHRNKEQKSFLEYKIIRYASVLVIFS